MKNKWIKSLAKLLGKARTSQNKEEELYKQNVYARLRKQREKIEESDYVFSRVKHRDENKHRHKLAALAAGSYLILAVDGKPVVLKRENRTVECVSRDCVTYVPDTRTKDDL